MANEELSGKVFEIVANALEVEGETLSVETKFAEDLGADSLDQADLVMAVEDEFDINVSEDAETKIKSVGDLVNYIDDQLKKKAS